MPRIVARLNLPHPLQSTMHFSTFVRLGFSFLIGQFAVASGRPTEIIAYVSVKDRVIQVNKINARELTRINYAFAKIRDGQVVEGFRHDAENYSVLKSLKKVNPSLQILASVGGWTWSGGFSDMALTGASRGKFIESAVAFVRKYGLDGIDIDWEYPGMPGFGNPFRPEDKGNYSALFAELRARFDQAGKQVGRPLITSLAAGA